MQDETERLAKEEAEKEAEQDRLEKEKADEVFSIVYWCFVFFFVFFSIFFLCFAKKKRETPIENGKTVFLKAVPYKRFFLPEKPESPIQYLSNFPPLSIWILGLNLGGLGWGIKRSVFLGLGFATRGWVWTYTQLIL